MLLVEHIEACARSSQFRINSSLQQMLRVLAKNKWLQPQAPVILIGGTNGKGTTAGYLCNLLHRHLGMQVGLYASPHLSSFCERIQLSHLPVDVALLSACWQGLTRRVQVEEQLTFFEWTTLLAFYVFNKHATDINVLEVGLGGEWDATNVCEPIASVIVSLGIDHQAYLGDTCQQVLADKLGIARAGKPLFWGNQGTGATDSEALAVLQTCVRQKNLQLYTAGTDFYLRGNEVFFAGKRLSFLPPALVHAPLYLQRNFTLALAISHWLAAEYGRQDNDLSACAKSQDDYLPSTVQGRFQQKCLAGKCFLLDACHNTDGAQAFTQALRQRYHGKLLGYVSLLADKDIEKILALLATCLEPLLFFSNANIRAAKRTHLPAVWQDCWYPDFATAWQATSEQQVCATVPTVVCGSFYGLDACVSFLKKTGESITESITQ